MGAMLVGGTYDKRGCSMRLVGMLVDTYGLDEYAPEYPLGAMPFGAAYDIVGRSMNEARDDMRGDVRGENGCSMRMDGMPVANVVGV